LGAIAALMKQQFPHTAVSTPGGLSIDHAVT
jgi:hypothetical protein